MGQTERALVVAAPARRALDRIPAKVAIAVLDFMLGPFIEDPERVGQPLRGDLAGLFSARVGAYRVVYEIDRSTGRVLVVMIEPPGRHLPAAVIHLVDSREATPTRHTDMRSFVPWSTTTSPMR